MTLAQNFWLFVVYLWVKSREQNFRLRDRSIRYKSAEL